MEIPETGPARLYVFVQRRLAYKRMSLADLAKQADISRDTLYRAAKVNATMRPDTLAKIDHALAWPAGTCADIIDGGTPPLDEGYRTEHLKVHTRLDGIESQLLELTAAVKRLEQGCLHAS